MSSPEAPRDETRFTFPARQIFAACFVLAVVGFAASLLFAAFTEGGFRRFSFAYLTNFAFFLSLALGCLFFVLIQHLTRAGWSVAVRRTAEMMAGTLPVLGAAFAPILISVVAGDGELYPWAASHDSHVEAASSTAGPAGTAAGEIVGLDPHTEEIYVEKKRAFLNVPFFLVRCVLYFGIWSGLAWWFLSRSRRQDETGDPRITLGLQRNSAPGIVLLAFTLTFAAFDFLMSLSPAWYSTIFGVYFFAGSAVSSIALLILVLMGLQRFGYIRTVVNVEHFHDLGKFLFGFTFFWGYIAFSQYVLIWYANLPETTFWFAQRGATTAVGEANGWTFVVLALLFGHFILPFLGLLSRHVKRSRAALAFFSVWLLVFHWIDIWWLVLPELGAEVRLGVPELATFLGLGALFFGAFVRIAAESQLVPVRDPRLDEALAFENL